MSDKTFESLVSRYRQLELEIALTQEIIGLVLREFGSRDGIEPKNIVVTDAGQPVPVSYVNKLIEDMGKQLLFPKLDSLNELKELKIE
tara:strand:- start:142 stop:405 length:264 start_codon:yes stop_codon:yes gene_type:complete